MLRLRPPLWRRTILPVAVGCVWRVATRAPVSIPSTHGGQRRDPNVNRRESAATH
jgi:hypothetical protein